MRRYGNGLEIRIFCYESFTSQNVTVAIAVTVFQGMRVHFGVNTKDLSLYFCFFFPVYTEDNFVISGYLYTKLKD